MRTQFDAPLGSWRRTSKSTWNDPELIRLDRPTNVLMSDVLAHRTLAQRARRCGHDTFMLKSNKAGGDDRLPLSQPECHRGGHDHVNDS